MTNVTAHFPKMECQFVHGHTTLSTVPHSELPSVNQLNGTPGKRFHPEIELLEFSFVDPHGIGFDIVAFSNSTKEKDLRNTQSSARLHYPSPRQVGATSGDSLWQLIIQKSLPRGFVQPHLVKATEAAKGASCEATRKGGASCNFRCPHGGPRNSSSVASSQVLQSHR